MDAIACTASGSAEQKSGQSRCTVAKATRGTQWDGRSAAQWDGRIFDCFERGEEKMAKKKL